MCVCVCVFVCVWKLLQLFLTRRLFQTAEMTNGRVNQTCADSWLESCCSSWSPSPEQTHVCNLLLFWTPAGTKKITSVNRLSGMKKPILNGRNRSRSCPNHSTPSWVMFLPLWRFPERHCESWSPRNYHGKVSTVMSPRQPVRHKSHEKNSNDKEIIERNEVVGGNRCVERDE